MKLPKITSFKLFGYKITRKSTVAMGGIKGSLYILDRKGLVRGIVSNGTKRKYWVATKYVFTLLFAWFGRGYNRIKSFFKRLSRKRYFWTIVAVLVIIIDILIKLLT